MTSVRHLRTAAGRLAGATERGAGRTWSFSVEGATFCEVDSEEVTFRLDPAEVAKRLEDLPRARRATAGPAGIVVALDAINGMQANALLGAAWDFHAPARATPAGPPPGGSDLPRIGAPATRALAGAGIHTLAEVAQRSREEIAALHGVGPRVVSLLEEALAERGLHFVRQ